MHCCEEKKKSVVYYMLFTMCCCEKQKKSTVVHENINGKKSAVCFNVKCCHWSRTEKQRNVKRLLLLYIIIYTIRHLLFYFLSTLFIIQCHPPIHGVTLHCHCTHSQIILATHWSSSLVWKWPWLLLQSLTVGRCSSDSWRCLTSSTPGFSSSGLFLAASPSQQQV